MQTQVSVFGQLTLEEKRLFVRSKLRPEEAPRQKKSSGMFNPTRTKLLKTFRLDQQIVRGSGHFLYDAEGREYLDFLAQYGAVPFGQNPPALWDVLRRAEAEQAASMIQPLIPVDAQRLAERLAEITPGDLEVAVFSNSGAEAVEAAIKLARSRTGRRWILATHNGFHGKTLGALSATGRPMYQKPFGGPAPHFDYVPFGDVEALAARIAADHDDIAAFIVEPIQGEGGVIPAPPGYLAAVVDVCRRHGVLVIADEIQTGLGRTGSLFAWPTDAGTPDIMLISKALGGGLMPIGACICRPDVWTDDFGLLHSSTFANNNLACRVALGVIDLLTRDNSQAIHHVAREGRYLLRCLEQLQSTYPNVIKAVRGKGFMVGLEFQPISGEDGSGTLAYCSMNDGLIAFLSSYLLNTHRIVTAPVFNSSHVLRLQPPLTVRRAEIDRVIEALAELCDGLDRSDCYQLVHHLVASNSIVPRPRPSPTAVVRRSAPTASPVDAIAPDRKFAFLAHYLNTEDIVRADPSFEAFTDEEFERWRDWARDLEPGAIHRLKLQSPTGRCAEGWLVALPMLPRDMLTLGRTRSLEILEQGRKLAAERGATVLGLGGFTAVISRGGQDLVGKDLSITSGNSLTSVMAVEAIEEVARKTRLDLAHATVAVVGATGSIGRLVSLMLASRVGAVTLVGNQDSPDAMERCRGIAGEIYRHVFDLPAVSANADTATPDCEERFDLSSLREGHEDAAPLVQRVRDVIRLHGHGDHASVFRQVDRVFRDAGITPPIHCSVNLDSGLANADIVVAATNADTALVSPSRLRSGTIVCDIARPANVAGDDEAPDVLVFDGGLVRLPQPITLGPSKGLPPGICWGCLGETITLTLEGETSDWSIGPHLSVAQAEHIGRLAEKHGIRPAPLLRMGKKLTEEQFLTIQAALASRKAEAMLCRKVAS